jgi:MFS family permease
MNAPGLDAGRGAVQASSRVYYGWAVLVVAAAAMVGTLPGRTQGLGLVTEPLLVDLGLTRVRYAEINLWATLIGAFFALGIGRAIDQVGSRLTLVAVTVSLGLVVCLMSQATSLVGLAFLLTLTRGLGQSALSVVSLTMVGQWFVRRVDMAMAIYTVTMSVGFMMAFPVVGGLVQAWGWRAAWWTVGCGLLIGLAPIGWFVVRRNPEACGLRPDGDDPADLRQAGDAARAAAADDRFGHDWWFAVRTAAFWVFALGASLYGLVASGIGLFNEAILAERGFDATMYYNTLVVTALTALAGNFTGGWLARRVRITSLLAASMLILAAGLFALPYVRTTTHVMFWATAMGLGGGFVTVLFFTVWPRVFGRRHLGRIQGAAQAMTVVASAVGPLVLAWCVEYTGTYVTAFYVLAVPVALVGLCAAVVKLPAAPYPLEK